MSSKDFLYLGLIAVTALVCYCHGFFSGVNRARKVYESLLGGQEDGEADSSPPGSLGSDFEYGRDSTQDWTGSRSRLSGQDLRGDFGNN